MTKRPLKLVPVADRGIRKKVETLKKKKLVANKVVSLMDFRELRRSIESRTILVVDDEEVMRSALKRILESEGYKILTAADGLELSRILENSRLDLILLDVNLPWVDGYDLCRLIKDHHSLKNVPVVLVSGRQTKEDVELGFEAGANDYVTKPFDIDTIMNSIHRLFLKSS